jgi:hypothetical protein
VLNIVLPISEGGAAKELVDIRSIAAVKMIENFIYLVLNNVKL